MVDIIDKAANLDTQSSEAGNENRPDRDLVLRKLLGTDYDFAQASGLIDMFYVNPETGYDGLAHVLGGDYGSVNGANPLASGFHHEPSAEVFWGTDEDGRLLTFVEDDHLEGANSKKRAQYARHPFEPYRARVVINGARKGVQKLNVDTGESETVPMPNGMFPKWYDALAVMQAVKQAVDSRDRSKDEINLDTGTIHNDSGEALLMDGHNKMGINLWLDAETGKVKTAHPLVNGGKMKWAEPEALRHAAGETGLIFR